MVITRESRFWVVTRPTTLSGREDICFQTDFGGLILNLKGGLDPADIVAVSTDESEARCLADQLLRERKASVGGTGTLDGRVRELLWEAITEPRLRDRAKALLDDLIAARRSPGTGSSTERKARGKAKVAVEGMRTASRGRKA